MISRRRTLAACLALSIACPACGDRDRRAEPEPAAMPTPDRIAAGAIDAERLLEEGYAFKREGRNGAALERFERACAILEQAVGQRDHRYASCLDDKAMVTLRMGRHEETRAFYEMAKGILERDPDPVLQRGVALRLGLLDRLDALGVRCREPAEPPPEADLPYFPDTAEMQSAIGRLGAEVRDCDEGRPRLVTVRVTITGDGRPVMFEIHGRDSGSPVGRCLEEKLTNLLSTVELPRFGACFRPFTFPFTVGDLPRR